MTVLFVIAVAMILLAGVVVSGIVIMGLFWLLGWCIYRLLFGKIERRYAW